MRNREVLVFKGTEELINAVTERWLGLAKKAVEEKGYFTVALSGGKTPIGLYRSLSRFSRALLWDKTHVFLVDERFVAANDSESNYRMIKEHLLNTVNIPAVNIHPVEIMGNLRISADVYEKDIIEFFKLEAGEMPIFDLIMLGVGEDGHTASLFPNDNALHEKYRLATAVTLRELKYQRITLTLPVLNNARNIIFLVTGENKAAIMKEILYGNCGLPASMVRSGTGSVSFMLDSRAGANLGKDIDLQGYNRASQKCRP